MTAQRNHFDQRRCLARRDGDHAAERAIIRAALRGASDRVMNRQRGGKVAVRARDDEFGLAAGPFVNRRPIRGAEVYHLRQSCDGSRCDQGRPDQKHPLAIQTEHQAVGTPTLHLVHPGVTRQSDVAQL